MRWALPLTLFCVSFASSYSLAQIVGTPHSCAIGSVVVAIGNSGRLICANPDQVKNQPDQISPIGTSIEVQDYRCTVRSPYTIECTDIGRVCLAARVWKKKQTDHYLGCATDAWGAAHPGEGCPSQRYDEPARCTPMVFGGL